MLGDPPGSSPFVSALQTPNIDGGGNAEAGLGEGGLAEMESHARRNESDRVVPSDILASLLECLCGARGWERLILSGRWGDTEISEALLGSTGWRVRGEALRQGLTAAGKSAVQEAVFEKMVERFSNESIIYKINKRKEAVDKGVVDIDKDGEHDSDEEVEGETVSESATDSDGGEPPGPVMARNRQPSGGYEIKGEFRTVSVMFACFNPGPDTEKAQKATALLLSALKKHGGIFSQYSVDDKGHTLLSLFGLPPFSHEQDAMNALRAGVLFLSLMDKSHMPAPTIGVATGEVLFTVSGAPARMDASFRGDVVNLSARLLGIGKICKVGIVCDYATRAACGPLDLEDLGVHVVKGKVMPIRVFGCDARSFLRHDRALGGVAGGNRVIGYRKEKNGILDTFQGWCKEGGPAVMVVEGMSGMGKSSLLEHVKTVAKDFLVPFWGSEIDRRTPYSSVSTLMSFIYHHSSDNAFGSLATMSQSRAMYSSTPTLRNQTVYAKISKEPSQTGGLSGDLAAFAAQYDVDKDLAPLVCAPINTNILTKWFDAASNEIFLELVKCSTQGFFVFFTRPAPDNAVLQEITQMPHCTHMVLKGFAAEDVAELMINVFKDDGERIERIDENITNAIFERCGGSPLFASMIITSIQLRHRDVCLVSEDGTLHVNSDIKDVRTLLLESVGAAITFQLDRLDPTFHDALKCGSIFGQDFDLEDLRVLIGSTLTSQELGEWMQMCDVFHFLQWSAVDDDDEESLHCTFRHITIMQVVYESQGFADRAILHQRAAERFEAMMSESNRDVLLPLVSYHFSNSDVQAKNVKYAEELGLKHMADYHLADLIMVFRSLLDHSKDGKTGSAVASDCGGVDLFPDSRLSLWHAALGFAFVQQAEWDMGELHTVEALKLLGIEWPTARNEKRAMQKAMMLQLRLFIKTKGGLKPLRDDDKIYQGRALLHNKAYRIVLENLQKTLFYCSSRFSKEKFVMIFFWSLNWAIQMCGEEPEHWCAFSFMAAKQLLWKSGKISSIYLKKGYAFLEKAGDSTYTGRAYLSSYLMEVVRFKESESILKEVEQ
ncbi:hypothetical protein HK101_000820 [Irineochytrium annulatum]|nr:hypothetical protein HK101_000820 [Irineochytrium annulatum]